MKKVLFISFVCATILVFIFSCEPKQSSDKEMLTITIDTINGTISGTSVTITLPYGTDVKKLAPVIAVSEKASIAPTSGTAIDFTNPFEYIITAEDGSTANVIVTISIEKAADLLALAPWIIKSKTINPAIDNVTDLLAGVDSCEFDEEVTFKADTTFTFDHKTICDGDNNSVNFDGTWSMTADDKNIIVTMTGETEADTLTMGKLSKEILELLEVRFSISTGKTHTTTTVYKHP